MVVLTWGSSPLTRGKRRCGLAVRRKAGLIPAHAGKTSWGCLPWGCEWAHPRSRGENTACVNPPTFSAGSSPLTRGKRRIYQSMYVGRGLIPAHAGKTPARQRCVACASAHPRSRGENLKQGNMAYKCRGSSPLTRGKRPRWRSGLQRCGLIPAHAGKTVGRVDARFDGGAHPRSRGENALVLGAHGFEGGSSPLTRGKRDKPDETIKVTRLIPAHAGKTDSVVATRTGARAHPRSRGENDRDDINGATASGSSPLTRGKQCQRDGL